MDCIKKMIFKVSKNFHDFYFEYDRAINKKRGSQDAVWTHF